MCIDMCICAFASWKGYSGRLGVGLSNRIQRACVRVCPPATTHLVSSHNNLTYIDPPSPPIPYPLHSWKVHLARFYILFGHTFVFTAYNVYTQVRARAVILGYGWGG